MIATDKYTDIAILRIDAKDLGNKELVPVQFEDTNSTRVGDFCLSIGANQGFSGSINFGIVSAFRRPEQVDPSIKVDHYIQTDLGINRGNSGCPLFDLNGKVIGMAVTKALAGEGVSFCIPAKTLVSIIDQLTKKGRVKYLNPQF